MKRWLTLFLFTTLLVACSTPAAVTDTPLPPTVTLQPTETLTPTPEATATATETPTPAEFKDAQAFLGDGFEVRPDGTVFDKTKNQEIPGLTIVPFNKDTMIKTGGPSDPEPTWAWQRVYEFKDKKDFTVNGTQYDISVLPGSGLDMYAWSYENGEFQRQNLAFAGPNGTKVYLEGESPQEVQYEIATNSCLKSDCRANSQQARSHIAIHFMGWMTKVTNGQWQIHYTYNRMDEIKPLSEYTWGTNFIPVLNSSGTWDKIESSGYAIATLGDRKIGLVAWYDKNGKGTVRAVEGAWIDIPSSFSNYWETHDWLKQ